MKRSMIILLIYLVMFGFLFLLAMYNYNINRTTLTIGLSTHITNLIMAGTAAMGVLKTTYHIYTF